MIINFNGKIFEMHRPMRDITKDIIVSPPLYEIKEDVEDKKIDKIEDSDKVLT